MAAKVFSKATCMDSICIIRDHPGEAPKGNRALEKRNKMHTGAITFVFHELDMAYFIYLSLIGYEGELALGSDPSCVISCRVCCP